MRRYLFSKSLFLQVIYSLCLYLLWPLLLIVTLVQKQRRQGDWRFVKERMGWFLAGSATQREADRIGFHAASLGELRSLLPLLHKLCDKTRLDVVITTNTPEAYRALMQFIAQYQLASRITHRYCSIDFPFATQRMLTRMNLHALWVVETELWLNLFCFASRRKVFLGILNARLSDKTLQAPTFIKRLYQQLLGQVDCVAARYQRDADAYIVLGANPDNVVLSGNLKRTHLPTASAINTISALSDKDYVLALSTRENEEQLVWQAWQQALAASRQNLLLVIAPRHIQRVSC